MFYLVRAGYLGLDGISIQRLFGIPYAGKWNTVGIIHTLKGTLNYPYGMPEFP